MSVFGAFRVIALAATGISAGLAFVPKCSPSPHDRQSFRMAQLGVGVIGCGRIGQIHSNSLAFRIPNAKLIAVSDPFEEAGRKVLEQTQGLPEFYKDYNQMLASPEIAAVVIGSPTTFHVEQILAAAAQGKHIYCEKPISNDLPAIAQCIEATKRAKVQLYLGFQRRYDTNFLSVKEQIGSGAIGDIRTFRICSRDPAPPPAEYLKTSGGIFLDMSSHDFDMARFLTGGDIEEVYVQGRAWGPEAAGADDFDTQVTLLKMSNGVIGTIENSRRCAFGYDQRVEVFGDKGSLQSENRSPSTVVRSTMDGITAPTPFGFFMDRYSEAYVNVVRAFVDACDPSQQSSPYLANPEDGKATLFAGAAAKLSAEQRRPVKVTEVMP